MRIISVNKPIIDDYSNFDFNDLKAKAKGLVGSGKLKGLVGDGQLRNLAGNILNKNNTAQQAPPVPLPKEQGMSKGIKIGLIVGGSLLLVGLTALIIIKSRKK